VIKIKGVPVSLKKTKKGSNLYVFVLENSAIVKIISQKNLEMLKPVEIDVRSFLVSDNKDLIFIE